MEIQKIETKKIPCKHEGYLLPFSNAPVIISQGYEGPYSHIATKRGSLFYDDRFSIDFALQLNTSVSASKSGIVFGVISSNSDYYQGYNISKGLSTPTNWIILEHLDNTFTLYSHLAKDRIKVKIHEMVNKGDIIAFTGLSGWIGKTPHLHFEAYALPPGCARASFPVAFSNYSESLYHKDLFKLH